MVRFFKILIADGKLDTICLTYVLYSNSHVVASKCKFKKNQKHKQHWNIIYLDL